MKEFLYGFVEWIQLYGIVGLIIVAFAESSFFPIPPDVLLIPMAFVHRERAILYALVTTVFSVMGAFLGYFIGKSLGNFTHRFLKKIISIKLKVTFIDMGPGLLP